MSYFKKYKPAIVNICTTIPPETVDELEKTGINFCHSTTRGLHPNLAESVKVITKHIGGACADELAAYFNVARVPCITHNKAKTTALLHILNNVHYGVNLIFADEAAHLCRMHGVDFFDYLLYTKTNNDGYSALGHPTKVRPVLTPPGGKIGGHCVTHSATLIKPAERETLFNHVAEYNED
jgi:UDP-N-acetyl-D-mannosaminuronate dehydrogenase